MNRWLIHARTFARKLGLVQAVNHFRRRGEYEELFCNAVMANVRSGDTVWDIGANVGFYTALFNDAVGPDGIVVAFEPAPPCYDILKTRMLGNSRVHVENVALGAELAEGSLLIGLGNSTTNRIVPLSSASGREDRIASVRIITCDNYWKRVGRTPNVVKIDVEGYEDEVIRGMDDLLKAPQLRSVFVEIHFSLLAQRGKPYGPVAIEKALLGNGFATRWIDWSHLEAIRV